MKLYKAHLESTCLQGSNYVVQLDLFYDDDEKTAKLFYSYLNNTLKCELKVALPQNTRGLRVHMQPTEYKSVAILCFKSMDDIKNIISTSSEVDAKKRFIAMLHSSLHLSKEIRDTFGSYSTANSAVVHNIPHVFLKLM